MSDEQSAYSEDAPLAHVVEGSGCFGSVSWNISEMIYNILSRDHRDRLLDTAGERIVNPYFTELTGRLLHQAGCSVSSSGLDGTWCFEQTVEHSCGNCRVTWLVGQGLWDALPEDQRDSLLTLSEGLIHEFFEREIVEPLFHAGVRQLRG